MKTLIPLIFASFAAFASPANATFSHFPTCAGYSSFLSGLITKIDRSVLIAPASLRPALLAARSLYKSKLALVTAGNYGVVFVGGHPHCIPRIDHASRA